MENNIFKGAKFGDLFLMRNGKIAIYHKLGMHTHHLISENNGICCNDNGIEIYRNSDNDIVSEYTSSSFDEYSKVETNKSLKFPIGTEVTCEFLSAVEGQPELVGKIVGADCVENEKCRYSVQFDGFRIHAYEDELKNYPDETKEEKFDTTPTLEAPIEEKTTEIKVSTMNEVRQNIASLLSSIEKDFNSKIDEKLNEISDNTYNFLVDTYTKSIEKIIDEKIKPLKENIEIIKNAPVY